MCYRNIDNNNNNPMTSSKHLLPTVMMAEIINYNHMKPILSASWLEDPLELCTAEVQYIE